MSAALPPEIPAFDLCGPLPTGVTVLEASAGTGKTFTIAALVARHVAAGTPIEQLLVITFTRMATGELRERVRERLVTAERGLARALAGVPPDPAADAVLALLADGAIDEVHQRRQALRQALADFDAATITTTHGFCQHVLGSLGLAGDVERGVTFLEDPDDLVEEVVTDLYVRKFSPTAGAPVLSLAEARRIAHLAIRNPHAPVEPAAAPRTTPPGMRRSLALAVRAELERRKRRLRVLTYDDQLTRLCDTLADPERGPAAARRLRQRYRVALVDEFQDTDPVQWQIMARAFGHLQPRGLGPPARDAALVLIGDPKQAIYAFRGADVHAYLEAAEVAGTRATLGVNWRSDQALLDAYDALFGNARLGHAGIAHRTVDAAPADRQPRLQGAPDPAALRLRLVPRDGAVARTRQGYLSNAPAREHIAEDLAADVVGLLRSGATVRGRTEGEGRPVAPGDLAVLVRTHKHAALVRDALDAAGVPAVINGAGSVFGTPTALHWLRLLEALERPTSAIRARAAALSPFLGWTAEDVALAEEATWEDVHARLHRWADVLRRRGVASLLEVVSAAEELPARVLARRDGERELTDLRHIGQLLHAAATAEQLGVAALTAWLRRRVAEAGSDTGTEERSRRLESDVAAVQVLTIHRSKGLEFPVVYYPYLWEPGFVAPDDPAVFHDPATRQRTIDVGMAGPDFAAHRRLDLEEQRGEELRLAYVALTRAEHQAVVWWAGSWNSRESVLCRLLFARGADGDVALGTDRPPEDDAVRARWEELAAAAPGCISVATAAGAAAARWTEPAPSTGVLAAAAFERAIDASWRRSSYSAITQGTREARVASEAEEPVIDDEAMPAAAPPVDAPGDTADEDAADRTRLRAVPCLLGDMPGGTEVGTHLHRVLEHIDFAAPDLPEAVAASIAEQAARRHVDIGDPRVAAAGLAAAITTPLGPLAGGRALRDVPRADRLDELWFELPLVGGDEPTGTLRVAAIGALVQAHLRADDPLAGYGERLVADAPGLQGALRGYLAGSLDLALRLPAPDGPPRFAVVDHKTNWLGVEGEPLTAYHYRPAALAAAMQRAHYPLQALLYSVALHRYLRWRLPGYRAERNLAGVLYLFLRGMTGPDTPRVGGQPCGVFAWSPPPALVEELSDLLDQGRAP